MNVSAPSTNPSATFTALPPLRTRVTPSSGLAAPPQKLDLAAWTSPRRTEDTPTLSIANPYLTSATTPAAKGGPPSLAGSMPPHAEHAASRAVGHRVAAALALGLAGFGMLGGMTALPQPAAAQVLQTSSARETQRSIEVDTRVRADQPVRAQSIDQVVRRFDRSHQLYVIGNPAFNGSSLTNRDLQRYREVLEDHPNVYVVLVDRTNDVQGDDLALSRGIGNSAAFQSVVNPKTGERDGAVFMIYHNVNGNPDARKIFLRTEAMLDRIGAGEADFAQADGTPGPMLEMFVQGIRDEGKDIPGALEGVIDHMQSRVDGEVQRVVGGATEAVQQARAALTGLGPKVAEFQRAHGSGGALGSPDTAGWSRQLDAASQALQRRDFAAATQLSTGVRNAVRAQEQSMARYSQAPEVAAQVRTQLDEVKGLLPTLPTGNGSTQAHAAFERASRSLEQYETQYRAMDPSFDATLNVARDEAATAAREAHATIDAANRADATRKGIAAIVTLAIVAAGVVANQRARAAGAQAHKELDAALGEIGERSNELMELLNTADVHDIAAYEGKTKELADRLRENVVQALTLVGGAQKFVDEADQLVNAKGVGALRNMFTTAQFNDAIALLTDPQRTLSFSLHDASRAVMEKGSKAATWREQILAQGETREFQKSLRDVLLAMADSRDAARTSLAELESKSADITGYLEKVSHAAETTHRDASALQQQAPETLFTAPSVTANLLPAVLSGEAEGGLLAKGRALAAHNFVAAWDDCAAPAERMTADARAIVDLGAQAQQTLVPAVDRADAALRPHGVKTDWAFAAQKTLSERLDQTANKALRVGVGEDVRSIGDDVSALVTRVDAAVRLDGDRRENVPPIITEAEQTVAAARDELTAALQRQGAFRGGSPDTALREPERDPSTRTADAHANVDAAKSSLDVGDVTQAEAQLTAARDLSADAHRLVTESREAVAAHAATLNEREQRTRAIGESVTSTYTPAMKRIKQTYAPEVLQRVAGEVEAGDTVADSIDRALDHLDAARRQTESAKANFDRAHVLTSRDDLGHADVSLRDAQARLDSVTQAETVLAERQQSTETDVRALTGRVSQTRANAARDFVRDHARTLMTQAESATQSARAAVDAKQRNPYAAAEQIEVAENLRQQVEAAIAADHQALEAARQAVSRAQGAVAVAAAEVASASGQSWHWSNSFGTASESVSGLDLAAANMALATAGSSVARAQGEIASRQYEAAASSAHSAASAATQASASARSAVSSARSRFESEKSRLESLEAAERARRQAEEARRQAEEASRSSGSSGGSFGGGGSGSRGGDF